MTAALAICSMHAAMKSRIFSFIEALYRILTLVRDRAKQLGEHCDKKANAIFDVIIDYALQCVNLSKNKVVFCKRFNPES